VADHGHVSAVAVRPFGFGPPETVSGAEGIFCILSNTLTIFEIHKIGIGSWAPDHTFGSRITSAGGRAPAARTAARVSTAR
jgi:hypothetical protein